MVYTWFSSTGFPTQIKSSQNSRYCANYALVDRVGIAYIESGDLHGVAIDMNIPDITRAPPRNCEGGVKSSDSTLKFKLFKDCLYFCKLF
ncbi:hypothetical protein J6590_086761 [Homalodisca vitripennis]|nr:hypothetical protein J6590_086761 [Homalodisca vitripennis]